MATTIKKWAVGVLITSVTLLTFMAILSIWDVFSDDVFYKSLASLGVLAFASLIVIAAAKSLEEKEQKQAVVTQQNQPVYPPRPQQ